MLFGLQEIMKLYNVKAVKSLSQNFIFDQALLKKIVSVGTLPVEDTIGIEIGPAAGNLSRALLGRGYSKILLIEKDVRFKPILEQLSEYSKGKIQVKFGDAMDIESSWIPSDWIKESAAVTKKPNLQIIGNLPFGVATPITLNLIKHFSSQDKSFFNSFSNVEMILLFQDEKFCAKIGTRDYGRLAVMSQAFCDVKYLLKIDSSKFSPKPKVDSGLVRFSLNNDRHRQFASNTIFDELESLTNVLLRHKNKKITSSNIPIPLDLGIDSNLRPVHLTPENFINILRFKQQQQKQQKHCDDNSPSTSEESKI